MAHTHHHHHHHEHCDHSEGFDDDFMKDPGNQAIAEALRLCFIVLKIVMVCALVLFVWSGFFTVESNERAVVLRFGAIRGGESISSVLDAGLHWAWPYPIEEVIKIPGANAEQELVVNDFWYSETDQEAMGTARRRMSEMLQFTRDGYSITASQSASSAGVQGVVTDYNIAHSKWKIRYTIVDPLMLFNKLWSGKKTANKQYDWSNVEVLLRSVLDDTVVVTSARNDIWAVWIQPVKFREDVELNYQARLAKLDLGIEAHLDLIGGNITPPQQVADAFNLASSAGITAQEYKKGAEAQRDKTLSQAEADATILVFQAEAYKTTITQAAMADANYLTEVLGRIDETVAARVGENVAGYEEQRRKLRAELLAVTVDQLYQEMLRDVMSQADETFVLNSDKDADVEWRPVLSRDATAKRSASEDKEKQQRHLYEHQPAPVSEPGGPPR